MTPGGVPPALAPGGAKRFIMASRIMVFGSLYRWKSAGGLKSDSSGLSNFTSLKVMVEGTPSFVISILIGKSFRSEALQMVDSCSFPVSSFKTTLYLVQG